MSLLQLIIIALLQGTTEWLPISSSGHVLLAADFFKADAEGELRRQALLAHMNEGEGAQWERPGASRVQRPRAVAGQR